MFGAFVVKIIIFLVWRIRNRWRPFVRENRARVYHWLLLLMNRHYLPISTVIFKYSKLFSRHITVFTSWENAKIRSHSRRDPPCFRHHSDKDSRKTPDICKWRIWDCAHRHSAVTVPWSSIRDKIYGSFCKEKLDNGWETFKAFRSFNGIKPRVVRNFFVKDGRTRNEAHKLAFCTRVKVHIKPPNYRWKTETDWIFQTNKKYMKKFVPQVFTVRKPSFKWSDWRTLSGRDMA